MNKKILSLTLLWILLLVACFQPVSTWVPEVPNPDYFYALTDSAPESVDPHWAYDAASRELIFNVYEGLVRFDHESVLAEDILPNLADSWTISEDGLTYTFHIDTSITFQNDASLSAEDVEYSFERGMVMDHEGGPMWVLYEPLTGRYSSRDWNLEDPAEVAELGQIIDDATEVLPGDYVRFNLAMPYAPFLQILCGTWSSILDKDWAISQGCWDGVWGVDYTDWLDYNNPLPTGPLDDLGPVMMGTGPYIFDPVDWPDLYRLNAWTGSGYRKGWPADGFAGYCTYITVENVEEWTTRETLFLAGDCDTVAVPVTDIASLITNWDYEVNISPQRYPPYDDEEYVEGVRCVKDLPKLSMSALCFNYDIEDTSPFEPLLGGSIRSDLLSDIDMRKAFAYAFNYTAYLKDVFLLEAIVPRNPALELPSFYANPDAPGFSENIAMATSHLKAAWGGDIWEYGFDLHVCYNVGNEADRRATKMCEYYIENVIDWTEGGTRTPPHVDVIPVAIPWAQYIPYMYSHKLPAFVMGRLADYPDPHNFFHPFMHEYGHFTEFQKVQYGQSGITQKGTLEPILDTEDPDYPAGETIDLVAEIGATEGAVVDNDYVNGLVEIGMKHTVSSERRAIYYELQDIYHYECASFPIYRAEGRHWERDWVQQWYYNLLYSCNTGPAAYFRHVWKGLDIDANGDGTINIIDAGVLCAHWYSPPAVGLLGYARNADIYPVSELDGEDYLIRGADGEVNILDALLLCGFPLPPPPPVPMATIIAAPDIIDDTMTPGSTFTIDITVANVSEMWGYEFTLSYDTTILTATSCVPYPPVDAYKWQSYIADPAGEVDMAYSMPMVIPPEGFTTVEPAPIMKINFTVDAPGSSPLDLHDSLIADKYARLIPHETRNGTVIIPILPEMQNLITTIESWNLTKGIEKGLTSKLDDAISLLEQGNTNGAIHKLGDFIKQLENDRKALTEEQRSELISRAQAVIAAISQT